ncbi:hypothetical protein [Winogradskyella schleiferi]|nr:hypothetical protein [Winogradskyella schleiferi]
MRTFTNSLALIFLCLCTLGCSEDDWLQGADYEVDVTFTGDIDEFD